MRQNKKHIFIFSSVHNWDDGRIFHRQARTLKENGYRVELHAVADFSQKEVEGIMVYGLPSWKSLFDRIRNIGLLFRRIVKSNAEVFHFHDPELLMLVPVIRLFKRRKVIYDVHEHYPKFIMEKTYLSSLQKKIAVLLFTLFEKIMLFFVDKVIYVTDDVGIRYRRYKKNDAIVLKNLPSINLFPDTPVPLEKREKLAVFLGNFTAVRGIREIIKAFAIVHAKYADYRLLLIGRYHHQDFKAEVQKLISELDMQDVVFHKEEIPYHEITQVLGKARLGYITYLPYPNNMAGLPNKMFEYMGAGLNIIASDFENYKNILIENDCGIVVKPEHSEAIAEATLRYIEDEAFAERMAKNARKAFEEKYNWEIEKTNLIRVYNSIE